MRRNLLRSLAALTATGTVLAACADSTVTGVRNTPAAPVSNFAPTAIQKFTLCANGPAGTYKYAVSPANPNGSINGVNPAAGTTTMVSLAPGACTVVASIVKADNFTIGSDDKPHQITVNQVEAPAGTFIKYIVKTEMDTDQLACLGNAYAECDGDVKASADPTVLGINFYHGSVATYWNEVVPNETRGCTLTQGYWKTHPENWPAGYSPTASFFGGATWLTTLGTPPKRGNAFLILAHQWIAATLNVASGASMPAGVKAAYDAGTTYLGGGAGTADQAKAWAATLDAYNNGLALNGPAHCD